MYVYIVYMHIYIDVNRIDGYRLGLCLVFTFTNMELQFMHLSMNCNMVYMYIYVYVHVCAHSLCIIIAIWAQRPECLPSLPARGHRLGGGGAITRLFSGGLAVPCGHVASLCPLRC